MKTFANSITKEMEQALARCVGTSMQSGYLDHASEVSFPKGHVEAQSIAIRASGSKEFLLINSEWSGETEKHGLDTHKLEVTFAAEISFLSIQHVKHDGHELRATQSPCKADFYSSEAKVTAVEVYALSRQEGDESVRYDKAIVFHTTAADPVVIQCVSGIQGGLAISVSKGSFESLKAECTVRVKM